jgi:hypothetical protein
MTRHSIPAAVSAVLFVAAACDGSSDAPGGSPQGGHGGSGAVAGSTQGSSGRGGGAGASGAADASTDVTAAGGTGNEGGTPDGGFAADASEAGDSDAVDAGGTTGAGGAPSGGFGPAYRAGNCELWTQDPPGGLPIAVGEHVVVHGGSVFSVLAPGEARFTLQHRFPGGSPLLDTTGPRVHDAETFFVPRGRTIATWRAGVWSSLPEAPIIAESIAVTGAEVVIAGPATVTDRREKIARWNGSSWATLPMPELPWVWVLWAKGPHVFVGDVATVRHHDGAGWATFSLPAGTWLTHLVGVSEAEVYLLASNELYQSDGFSAAEAPLPAGCTEPYDLVGSPQGTVFLACRSGGVFGKTSTTGWSRAAPTPPGAGPITASASDELQARGGDGLPYHYVNSAWTIYPSQRRPPTNDLAAVSMDELYVAGKDGIYELRAGLWTRLSGTESMNVHALDHLPDGTVFAAVVDPPPAFFCESNQTECTPGFRCHWGGVSDDYYCGGRVRLFRRDAQTSAFEPVASVPAPSHGPLEARIRARTRTNVVVGISTENKLAAYEFNGSSTMSQLGPAVEHTGAGFGLALGADVVVLRDGWKTVIWDGASWTRPSNLDGVLSQGGVPNARVPIVTGAAINYITGPTSLRSGLLLAPGGGSARARAVWGQQPAETYALVEPYFLTYAFVRSEGTAPWTTIDDGLPSALLGLNMDHFEVPDAHATIRTDGDRAVLITGGAIARCALP